jgi:hypothetical protein
VKGQTLKKDSSMPIHKVIEKSETAMD